MRYVCSAVEANQNLEDCLPSELKSPGTTITRIAAGLSGAGVYRVEAAGQVFVLKIAAGSESAADWLRTVEIQRRAADAGLSPRVVQVDEPRRAVLTAFVADQSFAAFFRDPRSQEAAIAELGRVVRGIHALPIPAGAPTRVPRELLAQIGAGLQRDLALPDFASAVLRGVLAAEVPPGERPLVLGHNDLNPTNLVYDGASIQVLDWAAAGPMDPFYDLAVLAMFLRMDEGASRRLLAAYDGAPLAALPARFLYLRRLAAALAGAFQLQLARQLQHPGDAGAAPLSLGEFYQQLRGGALRLGTAEGQWAFGLALLNESRAL
jgi:aminoglycoside phosphotransferase (APT) family kinase protein